MNWIKLGKRRLNLDNVNSVMEPGDGNACVYFNTSAEGGEVEETFKGEDAAYLLRYIDSYASDMRPLWKDEKP